MVSTKTLLLNLPTAIWVSFSESDEFASASLELTSLQVSGLGKLPVNDALYFMVEWV